MISRDPTTADRPCGLCRLPEDEWLLGYEGFDAADEGTREALLALGNGYQVTRGAATESTADGVHYPATYLSGLYNRLASDTDGRRRVDESLVNLPNWLPLTLRHPDGPWFSRAVFHIVHRHVVLNLRQGIEQRDIVVRDPHGRRTRIVQERIVSMDRPHVACLRTTITALDWSGPLYVRSLLDARVTNDNVAEYGTLARHHLTDCATGHQGDACWLTVRTTQSRIRIAQAARTVLHPHDEPVSHQQPGPARCARPGRRLGRDGRPLDLRGPRHRAVLARLIVARGQVVSVTRLADHLWDEPPAGAVGALRTFVAALRRGLEPEFRPRFLVTEGPGYALRLPPDAVDAWRFEASSDLSLWRGPAYAGLEMPWARAEAARLEELRRDAVEASAEHTIEDGQAASVVPELQAHVDAYPWRENGWRLLALYRADRQGDALAALRRARELLRDRLGVDPGPRLRRLETAILRQEEPGGVWERGLDRTAETSTRTRMVAATGLLNTLAVTVRGGPEAARAERLAVIAAAAELGDPDLAAQVIGSFDAPAIWPRPDDPAHAGEVVRAAERTLTALGPDAHDATRGRLLATIVLESRGSGASRPRQAAEEAVRIARGLGDPGLLMFALNGTYMQSFDRAGRAPERDRIGTEIVGVSARHGLANFEILGHLVRMQARGALDDLAGAAAHADAVDRLGARHERPLAGVFTSWFRAMTGESEDAYHTAAAELAGAGMPGVEHGLLPLALLCLRLRQGRPAAFDDDTDWGPYEAWARPLVLLDRGELAAAAAALNRVPDPPADLLMEALWCLAARAAVRLGDEAVKERARRALLPAAGEVAGAGSGMLTLGPVAAYLRDLR